MSSKKSKESELKKRLDQAEEILDALRNHKVDAVVGVNEVVMLRLAEVEDQLHEQIKISDNRLKEIESIYQNVPVGLCILDQDLKFTRVNEYLAKIHGFSIEDHMDTKICDLLPKLAGDIEQDLQQVIETGKAKMNIELRGETPAQPGVEKVLLEHWLPLHSNNGKVIGINMVIEEITERKKFEEELRGQVEERTKIAEHRADKLREMALEMTQVEEAERQRLARVLHDGLQQLLIGAKFNTKLISNQLTGHEDIKEQLEELKQILDQSIESSRSLSYELSPPILHDHGLLAALQWLADMRHMKGLSINIQILNELPVLSQDLKVFLFQVARELLVNIIKHAEVEQAEVRLSSDDTRVCIEVIDEGKGFDPEEEKQNFSSQGLTNIRKKLELMKGQLKIDSEPGKGSHFTITVPLDKSLPTSSTEEHGLEKVLETGNGKNSLDFATAEPDTIKKVLVVDDHQIMRKGLVKLLTKEPDIHIVGEASNGKEAVDFVNGLQPDIIIMDITMPFMDGIEATRMINQKFPKIRIVGLSMHNETEYATQIKKAGAIDLLNKGGPPELLFDAIRS